VITRPLVIIESPYAGEVLRNISYARAAVRDSVFRGEAPIASHLLFTQAGVLHDDFGEEREMGIEAGLAWARVCDFAAFYVDYGMSEGMEKALKFYNERRINTVVRYLNGHRGA
jgi:hypothetical protein